MISARLLPEARSTTRTLKQSVIVQTPCQRIHVIKLETVMWAEIDTTAAMQAHINRSMFILVNCINRAGAYTFPTPDALFFSNNDPASLPLTESSGRTGSDTGGRITAKTDEGHKTSGQSGHRPASRSGNRYSGQFWEWLEISSLGGGDPGYRVPSP